MLPVMAHLFPSIRTTLDQRNDIRWICGGSHMWRVWVVDRLFTCLLLKFNGNEFTLTILGYARMVEHRELGLFKNSSGRCRFGDIGELYILIGGGGRWVKGFTVAVDRKLKPHDAQACWMALYIVLTCACIIHHQASSVVRDAAKVASPTWDSSEPWVMGHRASL